MRLTTDDLQELAGIAVDAAVEAGRMIAQARPTGIEHKDGGTSPASQVVTAVDRRAEELILARLVPTRERFGLGLLTEERPDDGSRFSADHFWCIDPLDGTLPFVEGRAGHAVSIALVDRDGTPRIGVVHDPVTATTMHAIRGFGAFLDGGAWPARPRSADDELRVFADRSFVASDDHGTVRRALDRIAGDLGLARVRIDATAGAVMNACGVLAHERACYLKFPSPRGGGSLWDFAATACLFHELGAVATDVHGDPLDLNRADATTMNHRGVLFASDPELAGRLRRLVARIEGQAGGL